MYTDFQVSAVTNVGEGSKSVMLRAATTAVTPPMDPKVVSIEVSGSQSALVKWSAPVDDGGSALVWLYYR